MPARRYHILFNAGSGTATALGLTPDVLAERFAAAGHTVTIDADADFATRLAKASMCEADTIVAAGGDGTATALSGVAIESGKTFALLPLGTANLLARDLNIPLDLDAWFAALDTFEERRIDVGEVNGHLFLHKVVVGLVPGIAAGREAIRGRDGLAAGIGFMRYALRRFSRTRRLALEITPDDGAPRVMRVRAIAVANNSYDEGFGRFFARRRLDGGSLCLYVLRRLEPADLLRLIAGMLVGRWQKDEALAIENVKSLSVRASNSVLNVMIDGEVASLEVPLVFSIRPAALPVLAPPVTGTIPAAVEERHDLAAR